MWGLLAFDVCTPAPASSAGYGLGALFNYYLNHRYTFRSLLNHQSAVLRFAGLVAIGLTLNAALLDQLSQDFGLNLWVSQIIATIAVTLINFLLAKLWVYRSREDRSP